MSRAAAAEAAAEAASRAAAGAAEERERAWEAALAEREGVLGVVVRERDALRGYVLRYEAEYVYLRGWGGAGVAGRALVRGRPNVGWMHRCLELVQAACVWWDAGCRRGSRALHGVRPGHLLTLLLACVARGAHRFLSPCPVPVLISLLPWLVVPPVLLAVAPVFGGIAPLSVCPLLTTPPPLRRRLKKNERKVEALRRRFADREAALLRENPEALGGAYGVPPAYRRRRSSPLVESSGGG